MKCIKIHNSGSVVVAIENLKTEILDKHELTIFKDCLTL